MSQYVITCSKKLMKATTRQEIDNISVPSGYAICFYDGQNIVLKNDSNQYIPVGSGQSSGRGNILGGYAVKVTSVVSSTSNNVTTHTLTLESIDKQSLESVNKDENVNFEKFSVGQTITINISGKPVEEDGIEEDMLYLEAQIVSIDSTNSKITVSNWIYPGTSEIREIDGSSGLNSDAEDGKIFIWVPDSENIDSAVSDGDKNFVVGVRSSASGSWNTVVGMMSRADGGMNVVQGDISHVTGTSNQVYANNVFVAGTGNRVSVEGTMTKIIGNSNEIKSFGAVVIGDSNRTFTGVNGILIGNSNKGTGNNAIIVGTGNETKANGQYYFGNNLTSEAEKSTMVGAYGILDNSKKNKYAVAVCGGEHTHETVTFIHRCRKPVIVNDEEVADEDEVAYSHEYRGRLNPEVLIISSIGNVGLDHDQYAKWKLTGSGTVNLSLSNWEDGDLGQVVLNTSNTSVSYPNDWAVDPGFDTILATGGIHIIFIEKEVVGNVTKIFAYCI